MLSGITANRTHFYFTSAPNQDARFRSHRLAVGRLSIALDFMACHEVIERSEMYFMGMTGFDSVTNRRYVLPSGMATVPVTHLLHSTLAKNSKIEAVARTILDKFVQPRQLAFA